MYWASTLCLTLGCALGIKLGDGADITFWLQSVLLCFSVVTFTCPEFFYTHFTHTAGVIFGELLVSSGVFLGSSRGFLLRAWYSHFLLLSPRSLHTASSAADPFIATYTNLPCSTFVLRVMTVPLLRCPNPSPTHPSLKAQLHQFRMRNSQLIINPLSSKNKNTYRFFSRRLVGQSIRKWATFYEVMGFHCAFRCLYW